MKTIENIEIMKNKKTSVFGNAYNYLIEQLSNYYISKSDGKLRIKNELKNWDVSAQRIILTDIKTCVEKSGMLFEWT